MVSGRQRLQPKRLIFYVRNPVANITPLPGFISTHLQNTELFYQLFKNLHELQLLIRH